MKKIIIATLVCFSVVACKESAKVENVSKVSVANESQIPTDSIDNFIMDPDDKEYLPTDEGLPLFVLTTGGFHGDETSLEMVNKGWFGIFRDREKYYITPTSLTIKKAFDAVLDEDEEDASKWTGWEVTTSHIDTSLVLISGSPRLSSHEIKTVPLQKDFVDPNGKMSFTYNGVSYTLYATAEIEPSQYNEGETIISHYKLYIKGVKDGKEVKQLLASTHYFDDAMFRILLIGDIDEDGFPDLILDTSNHYNAYRPTVYLSSFADKNQLVKVVGLHLSVGC